MISLILVGIIAVLAFLCLSILLPEIKGGK